MILTKNYGTWEKYVWFMVENPDYLKFLFLNNHKYEIIVEENKLETKI